MQALENPQARREVVAQTLHYVSALSGWSYADLQRQVAAALGRKGNNRSSWSESTLAARLGSRNLLMPLAGH